MFAKFVRKSIQNLMEQYKSDSKAEAVKIRIQNKSKLLPNKESIKNK